MRLLRLPGPEILALLAILALASPAVALPAFPGAEGFGAETPGGRGGKVIEVTNLDDSGPGSLRAACEASGPRIVVFRVGGTIRLKSHLRIRNPYITIAGQTAPGDGILLRDAGLSIRTHDVVARYLRVRIGESRAESPGGQDCLSVQGEKDRGDARNVVVDHCSFSWGIDENADSYSRASDTTIQWCIFSEGLANSIHEKGRHSMGLLLGEGSTRTSVHHCLFAHNNQRNPRVKGGLRDFANNVAYNWGDYAVGLSDNPQANFVGCYYKPGPNSRTDKPAITSVGEMGTVYLEDNRFHGKAASEWEESEEGVVRASRRFDAPEVTIYPAHQAFRKVLSSAGCVLPVRDQVDARVVREVISGAGKIIDRPEQVGGFPEMKGGTAPVDSDQDGMPDDWERSHDLNPRDASDGPKDRDGDGYTNVEEYINALACLSLAERR